MKNKREYNKRVEDEQNVQSRAINFTRRSQLRAMI